MFGISHGLYGGVHHHSYGIVTDCHHQRQACPNNAEKPDRRSDDGSQLPVIARTGRYTNEHGDACGQSQDDARHCLHHLAADGYTRHAGSIVKLPYHKKIGTSIEGLKHIGQQIRYGKLKQYVRHLALSQVKFFLHTTKLLFYFNTIKPNKLIGFTQSSYPAYTVFCLR